MDKGQIALEYLIILTVVLGALIPLVFLSFSHLEEHKAISDVNSAYNMMAASINQCFSLSPGSKITTRIYMPQSYDKAGSNLNANVLKLKFNLPNGDPLVISESVKGNIQGDLPDMQGYYTFTFELLDSNVVEISYIGA